MEVTMNRWMKRTALSLCLAASLGAAAEVAGSKEKSYIVKYSDGTAERYKVKWTLNLATSRKEEGGSFVPYQGANQENRRCTMSVASSVDRTVSMVTRLGQAIPLPGMNRTMNKESRSSPCDDKRDKAVDDTRTLAMETFDRVTNVDLEDIRKETQASAGVVAITME
jgi:hypothetical protein